jgi:hypothetical protein
MNDAADRLFRDAFERLRLRHLAFRRAEPEEAREIEAMRLEVLRAEADTYPSPDVGASHIAELRLRLMERAFYLLRLEYFANARENLGWMNLFRDWSGRKGFASHYDGLRYTLSPQFRAFYHTYIAGYDEDPEKPPVHHPWLRRSAGDVPGFFMDIGRTEPDASHVRSRSGAGAVDDAKGQRGVDQGYEGGTGGVAGDGNTSGEGGGAPNA